MLDPSLVHPWSIESWIFSLTIDLAIGYKWVASLKYAE